MNDNIKLNHVTTMPALRSEWVIENTRAIVNWIDHHSKMIGLLDEQGKQSRMQLDTFYKLAG